MLDRRATKASYSLHNFISQDPKAREGLKLTEVRRSRAHPWSQPTSIRGPDFWVQL